MSKPLIKSTYHLDASTVRKLDDMARRRGVTASEALREAVKLASLNGTKKKDDVLKALDNLQTSLKLTSAKARAWANTVHTERRASSSRAARMTGAKIGVKPGIGKDSHDIKV